MAVHVRVEKVAYVLNAFYLLYKVSSDKS